MAKETMTWKEALIQLQLDYNNYQNYRKNKKQSYELATKEDILEFGTNVVSEDEAVQLMKSA